MTSPRGGASSAEIHRLMGEASAAYGHGDSAAAALLCERVLVLQPELPDALHLLGLCVLAQGHAPRAAEFLERAAALKPGDAALAHHLGIMRMELGDTAGAREAFARSLALNPRHMEAQFNYAVTSDESGEAEAAESAYRRVLELDPRHAAAASGLAALLEQKNALEEAERWTAQALALDPADAVAHLTQAQLDFRAGHLESAVARLESLLKAALTSRNRALAAGRLGAVYDRLERPADAWRMFLAAKAALKDTLPLQSSEGVYSFATAARVARHMDALLAAPAESIDGQTPVFLVGFPRSGTTLLDQILSSHSRIEVLEEKDTLLDSLREFALSDATLGRLARLPASELEPWRQRYWQRVTEYMPGRDAGRLFVDKLPLNTQFLPLMHRLFPTARFIFALRDPRDVVLSCFMQTFTLNEAMRHFLSLDETARYYAAVMDVGQRSVEALGTSVHRMRYEDLVEDAESEARKLVAFLGLSWEDALLDFQTTAKKRRIATPSYHQVAQPIYKASRQRWRRYAAELASVMSELEPFLGYFGYS